MSPTTTPILRRRPPARKPTWAELVEAEPRLGQLLREIRAIRRTPGKRWCANAVWYGYGGGYRHSFKGRLSRLVGYDRRGDPLLGTEDAYDRAYETLYDTLPDCNHDGLFC
jgi:hypothetical protein